MPDEVVADTSELDQNDINNPTLISPRTSSARTPSTRRKMSRADSYSGGESDSSSDDGNPTSPKSTEADHGELEDSFLPKFRAMSMGSDTSTASVDSGTPERENGESLIESSLENSQSGLSEEESDSEDELTEDRREKNLAEILRRLTLGKLERDENSNHKTENENPGNDKSKNDNDACNRTRRSDNTSAVSSGNERNDTASGNDSEDDDEFTKRSPFAKQSHHGGKPYDRTSPRREEPPEVSVAEFVQPEDLEPIWAEHAEILSVVLDSMEMLPTDELAEYLQENNSTSSPPEYIESTHGSPVESPEPPLHGQVGYVQEWNTNSSSHVYVGSAHGSPVALSQASSHEEVGHVPEWNSTSSSPGYSASAHGSPVALSQSSSSRQSDSFEEFLDSLSPRGIGNNGVSPTQSTEGLFQPTEYRNEWYNNRVPSVFVEDTDRSPEMGPYTVKPPLLSDSTGSVISSNADSLLRSPVSYNGEHEWNETITIEMQGMVIPAQTTTALDEPYTSSNDHMPGPRQGIYGTQSEQVPFVAAVNQTGVYNTSLPAPVGNMPSMQKDVNICQTVENSFLSATTSPFSRQSPTTRIPNGIPSTTNRDGTSKGFLIVNPENECGHNIAAFRADRTVVQGQTNELGNYNVGPTKGTSNGGHQIIATPSISPPTITTSANTFLIPAPVDDIHQRSSPRPRNQRRIATWTILDLPSVPALERLKQHVDVKKIRKTMSILFEELPVAFAVQNKMGDTCLMTVLRELASHPSNLAHIPAILAKMGANPNSLTLRNHAGHDALYLAAIGCPTFDFVTGLLGAAILKSPCANDVWRRTYDNKNTLIHVIAERGDTHEAVLRELLAIQKTSKLPLFDLSAENNEGKTPLHVAVEVQNLMGTPTGNIVRLLMKYGANPTIREHKNGNTALHMAMSSTSSLGMVQALLFNDAGRKATNIMNYAGNTPVHLAAGGLNNAKPRTQSDVCFQLIAAGGKTNIRNRQNKVPLGLVASDRRDVIERIFHKRS